MKKIALSAAVAVLLTVFAGATAFCADNNEIQNVQLSEDGVLTWDPFEGATQYWITFEPDCAFKPEGTSADLYQHARWNNFLSGTHSFSLVACDDNWNNLSRRYNGTYEFTAPIGLPTPTNPRWDGFTARWDAVEGAAEYKIYIFSGESNTGIYGTSDTFYDFSGNIGLEKNREYTFAVSAISASEEGGNSELSEHSSAIEGWFERREIQNVRVDDNGTLSWDAYEGATRYWLRFGTGAWQPDGTSINLDLLFAGSDRESGEYKYDLVACNDSWNDISYNYYGTYYYEKALLVVFVDPEGDVISRAAVKSGEKVARPADPESDGMVFAGWLLNESPFDFDAPVTENLTVTAQFTEKSVMTDAPTEAPITDEPTAVPATDAPTEAPATDVPATLGGDTPDSVPAPGSDSDKRPKTGLIVGLVIAGTAIATGVVTAVLLAKKKKH